MTGCTSGRTASTVGCAATTGACVCWWLIGVDARGDKHFLAIEEGVRESTRSWCEVLLGMKQRGFTRPAKPAVGDGALGFWSALSEVYPETRGQRFWMHKSGNVLNYFPKSGPGEGEAGSTRELDGRDPGRGRARVRRLDRTLRGQVSEGECLPGLVGKAVVDGTTDPVAGYGFTDLGGLRRISDSLQRLVGVRGFEPRAPASRRQCSTRLSYTPKPPARPLPSLAARGAYCNVGRPLAPSSPRGTVGTQRILATAKPARASRASRWMFHGSPARASIASPAKSSARCRV